MRTISVLGMSDHIVKSFSDDLHQLATDITRMGGLAERQVGEALDVFMRRNAAGARAVIERDTDIDNMQKEIERQAIRILVLRQPVAQDMRQAVTPFKIVNAIERIGDLAKNIAKRTLVLAEESALDAELLEAIAEMGKLVRQRICDILDAYATLDLEAATRVWMKDEDIDEQFDAVFHKLLSVMRDQPEAVEACAHLLFVAKNLERIGDHATNIAEIVHFLVTGEEMGTHRPRGGSEWPTVS